MHLALAEEKATHAVKRELAPLRRIHLLPSGLLHRSVEEPEQWRQTRFQHPVEGEQFAGDLLAYPTRLFACLDLKIPAQQIEDREKRSCLAVRYRAALDDQPTLRAMRMGELPKQPRFTHPWFTDDGDDLPAARGGVVERFA